MLSSKQKGSGSGSMSPVREKHLVCMASNVKSVNPMTLKRFFYEMYHEQYCMGREKCVALRIATEESMVGVITCTRQKFE